MNDYIYSNPFRSASENWRLLEAARFTLAPNLELYLDTPQAREVLIGDLTHISKETGLTVKLHACVLNPNKLVVSVDFEPGTPWKVRDNASAPVLLEALKVSFPRRPVQFEAETHSGALRLRDRIHQAMLGRQWLGRVIRRKNVITLERPVYGSAPTT